MDIKAVITKHQKTEEDTGSAAVQITLLTQDIQNLQKHFEKFNKDLHSRKGLMQKINERRKLMGYLKEKDRTGYKQLVVDLGIRG